MYDNKASHINWREQELYGAKRLGTFLPNLRLGTDSIQAAWDTMGHKRYELTNHLGNVMATITDRRLQAITHDSVVTAFDAEVVNAQDYNSFGSIMEGRQLSTADSALYRYGFNGKENDNDVGKGNGGEQDYGARIYDPRIGRFLSIDPLQHQYPELTPYQFSSNSPVQASDLDGLEADFSKGKIDLLSYNKDDDDETKVNVFTVNTVLNIYNSAVDMVEMATNFNPVTNIIYKGKGYDKLLNTSKTTVAGAYDWTVNTSWGQKGEDLKNAATNPHNYEAVAALIVTHKLGEISGSLLRPETPILATNTGDGFLNGSQFGKLASEGTIDPKSVRFSQNSISGVINTPSGAKASVSDFVNDLKNGHIDPSKVNPIRIVVKDGKVFTLDNRRLFSFQRAGMKEIPYIKIDEVPKNQNFKFTTTNEGQSIEVRR